MNDIAKFWKRYYETEDLMNRGRAVYPVRRDLAALKKRRDSGDKNVVAYVENGHVYDYQLQFTPQQKAELESAFRKAKGPLPPHSEDHASFFVGLLESFGDAILDSLAIEPPDQKTRQRAIDSFVSGIEKFDAALADLDSSALGWLYANTVDKLSSVGMQVSDGDGDIVSMREHPLRAQVEAGELRKELRALVAAISSAAIETKATLPIYRRNDHDARLTTAKALERQIIDHGLEFVTTETGFPAQCLRSMFELAGLETEKVSYWLKKVADDPDSYAKFRERMTKKFEGKNPPAV